MYQNGYVPPKPSGRTEASGTAGADRSCPQMMDAAAHGSTAGYVGVLEWIRKQRIRRLCRRAYRPEAQRSARSPTVRRQYMGQSATPGGTSGATAYAAGYQRQTYRQPQQGSYAQPQGSYYPPNYQQPVQQPPPNRDMYGNARGLSGAGVLSASVPQSPRSGRRRTATEERAANGGMRLWRRLLRRGRTWPAAATSP